MQWTGKLITRLKKKREISLKKEKKRNHKMTLNTLTVRNKNIMREITTRNPNKTEQFK
jgi:FixJ family two-component response regulator